MDRATFEKRAKEQREKGPMTRAQKIVGPIRIGQMTTPEMLAALARSLAQCPFDGGDAALGSWAGSMDRGGRELWVECSTCGVALPRLQTERWKQGYGTFFADDDAVRVLITEWNRRA